MTFFFQTNHIGVILKIVLLFQALSLQSAGVSVQLSTSRQIKHPSVIKRASHGSGRGGIKASCSESTYYKKKKNRLNLSNIICFCFVLFFFCFFHVKCLYIRFTLFFLFTSHSLSCLSKEMDEFMCCKSNSSYSAHIAINCDHYELV